MDRIEAGIFFWDSIPSHVVSAAAMGLCLTLAVTVWLMSRKTPVYLCDFYCFHPPEKLSADVSSFCNGMRRSKRWKEQSLDFMDKVSAKCGLGDSTYFPEGKNIPAMFSI